MTDPSQRIIDHTKKWIMDVVIGCNFCPFAARVVKKPGIQFRVEMSENVAACLEALMDEVAIMDGDAGIETSIVIFPNTFSSFNDYLDAAAVAEHLLKKEGYEGVYQLATFHPLYFFEGSDENDAANYTNRSVYPMMHLLRESSIDRALEHYEDPGNIPVRNTEFARAKGLTYMKMLRDACSE